MNNDIRLISPDKRLVLEKAEGQPKSVEDLSRFKVIQDSHRVSAFGSEAEGAPRILSRSGDTAEILVSGVLTDEPDFWAWLFYGNTTYHEIMTSIAICENDPDVKTIKMKISSPGGDASAYWLEAMTAVYACQKPIEAVGINMVASAAYGIGSQATNLLAMNEMTTFGSIGVRADFYKDNDDIVTIVSDGADKKAPDLETESGVAVIKDRLNSIHEIFVGVVAQGRNVSVEKVKSDFGQGALLFAKSAINVGMADGIVGQADDSNNNQATEKVARLEVKMDLNEFKKEHPEAYAQAVAEGQKAERIRTSAFLTYGQAADMMDEAISAIENGDDLDEAVRAKYMVAANNVKTVVKAIEEEEADEQSPASSEKVVETAEDKDDKAVSLALAASLGQTVETEG